MLKIGLDQGGGPGSARVKSVLSMIGVGLSIAFFAMLLCFQKPLKLVLVSYILAQL